MLSSADMTRIKGSSRWLLPMLLVTTTAIADAPTSATVPNVFDMTQADAEAALKKAGFEGRITLDKQSSCGSVVNGKIIELGRICNQSPAAGQTMGTKRSLTIRVQHENPHRGDLSNGRFWFLMPDLTGMEADAARAKLKELGAAKEVKVFQDKSCKPNIVCKQNPRALTRADNTSEKSVTVGVP